MCSEDFIHTYVMYIFYSLLLLYSSWSGVYDLTVATETSKENRMSGYPGVLGGICPNPQCKKKLYFPAHEASVECTGCGQRHTQSGLKNLGVSIRHF